MKLIPYMVVMVLWWGGGAKAQSSSPPALFVFGDSLVDNGNNNFIVTTARADYRPYGIDLPNRQPTGRFSNGLHIPDFISQMLGAEPVLPYLNPTIGTGNNLLRGANFASAGIGILNDTGIQFGAVLRMAAQLDLFTEYQNRVAAIIGRSETDRLVANGLVSITLGGNDYVNNYYLVPVSARSLQYNIEDYTRFIISEYRKILMRFYELGARRVMVTAVGALGCIPSQRATTANGECVARLQRAASLFNQGLLSMLNQLNTQYSSNVFTFANSFRMDMDYISNPTQFGFQTSEIACCGQGRFNGVGNCTPTSNVCPDRTAYVFWDPFHPSESACRLIANRLMNGGASDMNPVNLTTLMQLDL